RVGRMHLDDRGSQSRVSADAKTAGATVPVTTLTEIMSRHKIGHVDLLQVDVEGAELPVLRGFPWSHATVGCVLCELHPYAWKQFGYAASDVQSFLRDHGYRCIDTYLKEHIDFPD